MPTQSAVSIASLSAGAHTIPQPTLRVEQPDSSNAEPLLIPLGNIAFSLRIDDGSTKVVHLEQAEGADLPTVQTALLPSTPSTPDDVLDQLPLLNSTNSQARRHLHIIANDTAGSSNAVQVLTQLVEPLLSSAGVTSHLHRTQCEGDAGRIGAELLAHRGNDAEGLNIAVLGGDGTTHELLNGVLSVESGVVGKLLAPIRLVLLPLGTANALYYHFFPPENILYPTSSPTALLYSLLTFLRSPTPTPLPLALNTMPSSPYNVITAVVASASLHAAILHDAEELRASIPSIERFKVAAQKNSTIRSPGTLTLQSPAFKYSSSSKQFEPLSSANSSLQGPFSYLASAIISRFESNFLVAPFRSLDSSLAPSSTEPSVDIIVVHPPQDSSPEAFVPKLWEALGGMYAAGAHVDNPLIEYYRAPSFSWKPRMGENDLKSNVVCLDGAIHAVAPGGSLESRALSSADTGVYVWQ